MSEKSTKQLEEKLAKEKFDANRKKILEGIVDTSNKAEVSFFATHCGARFVLNEAYGEFVSRLESALIEGNRLIRFRTFSWTGERGDKMQEFESHMQPELMLEVTKVDDEQWYRFITETADRATMARMNPGGAGAQGIMN